MEDLRTGGESIRSGRRPDDGSDPMPREAGPPSDRPANRSFRAEDDDQHVSPTAPSADKPDATSIGFSTYVHDACTRPPYGRVATVSGSTRLGEAVRCERWATESNWGRARRSSWSSCWR